MSKSKWNNKSSISIESLTEKELKEAISEWAEGSPQLEALLWNCHNKGIETCGCDAGGHHFPYLDVSLTKSSDNIKKLIRGAFNFGNSCIGYRRVVNPFSGPNWHMPVFDFSPIGNCDASSFFEKLNTALEENAERVNDYYDVFLSLFNFFNTKEYAISIWLQVVDGVKFCINFCCDGNKDYWKYFEEIFEKTTFTLTRRNENWSTWSYASCNFEEIMFAVKKLYELFKQSEALFEELPYDEELHFFSRALIMRKKFGTDKRGIELMNEWLNQRKYNPRVIDANY